MWIELSCEERRRGIKETLIRRFKSIYVQTVVIRTSQGFSESFERQKKVYTRGV